MTDYLATITSMKLTPMSQSAHSIRSSTIKGVRARYLITTPTQKVMKRKNRLSANQILEITLISWPSISERGI